MSFFSDLFSKSKPKEVKLTGRVIDMTRHKRGWGHNFSLIKDREGKSARFAMWLTPGPAVGDQLQYEVNQGLVTVRIDKVEWTRNVIDMYFIDVSPLTLNGEDVQ